jgi:ribosomal protein L4
MTSSRCGVAVVRRIFEHAGRELHAEINKKMYRAGMASIFSQLAREAVCLWLIHCP